MSCRAGIGPHVTNSILVVIDASDQILYQKRLHNNLRLTLTGLGPTLACE